MYSKRQILAPVTALLLSVALLIMGNGLQTTILPIRAGLEHFSAIEIGVLGSSYFVGFIVGCLGVPYLILNVGHIRTFTALVAIASTASLLHPMIVDPGAWMMTRLLTGACLAGLHLIIESWLNERATNETRGLIMSTYIVINFSVITIGQLMVMLYEPQSFALFSLASVLVSLAAVPVALTRSAQPAPITLVRFNPRKLISVSPTGVAGVFLVGLANGSFWALGPVFGQRIGLSVEAIAFFLSVTVIGGAIAQWPLGRLSDKIDRRLVMVGAAGASTIFSLALASFGDGSTATRLTLAFLFGATTLPAYAIAVAQTFDHAAPGDYVEISAGLLLLNGLGSAIGPLIAAVLIEMSGAAALYLFIGGVECIIVIFALSRIRMREGVPEAEKEDFDLANTGLAVMVGDAEAMEASPLVGTSDELKAEENS
ncbi:MFS transporter [Agaricicola taiwanensis]|uniref:MFS transporter n=1 Tax=Agaricicola taiwanensis TaxID=591372 RepID=A0A8J2YGV9_9RHOB|nr:MFS transporter [Agaricicola taiwanensis]GGE41922.1 MFS transporter [Agaricicola taiwanensis]